jgi:hypothetical protein
VKPDPTGASKRPVGIGASSIPGKRRNFLGHAIHLK